jgi:hypothetical protein
MATLSKYISSLGSLVKNQQKLLGYHSELYEFYNDKRPDNKYIYYLDENPYLKPATSTGEEVIDFFAADPLKLNFLQPSVRIFKVFKDKKKKRIEFPLDNFTDFGSFEDPVKFIGGETDFITDRFMGPQVGLKGFNVSFKGLSGGKGATPATLHSVIVGVQMEFQDVKMLFKNLHSKENIKYKDIFASPGKSSRYRIVIEVGFNAPDNLDMDLESLTRKKMTLVLYPLGAKTDVTYNQDGSASLQTTLTGFTETAGQSYNMLNPKYYKNIRKSSNMRIIENEEKYSLEELTSKQSTLDDLIIKKSLMKQQTDAGQAPPPNFKDSTGKIESLKKEVEALRKKAQIASQAGSIPPVFSFVSVLFALGKVYYFDMENEIYKKYIQKIAQGEEVDVQELRIVPDDKKSQKLKSEDIMAKVGKSAVVSDSVVFTAGDFKIKRFSLDDDTSSSSKFDKVKFFYFGDLLNIILNNQSGGGMGQDLDDEGDAAFKLLLGPTVFIKNKSTKKIYNIANTPISLDMFLFELNRMIISRNLKTYSLRAFFSQFMKKFFDLQVLGGEKEKTGKDVQYFEGGQILTLDAKTIDHDTKTIKNFGEHVSSLETSKTEDFLIIKNVLYDLNINKKRRKKSNIPTIFLGGPDKGPLASIKYNPVQIAGLAEATLASQYNASKGGEKSVGEADQDSILITSKVAVDLTLIGNPFLNISDKIYIDSRFVDGGFFQQKNNLLFFTGLFNIYAVEHSIQGNKWTTSYKLLYVNDLKTKTYSAPADSTPPPPQNASLAEEAKNNSSGTIKNDKKGDESSPSKKKSAASVSKPNKPNKPTKVATAKTMAEHEANFADPDNPTKAEMTAWSKATE